MGVWDIHYNLPVEFYGHTPTSLLKFSVVTLRYACVTTHHINTTHHYTPRKILSFIARYRSQLPLFIR